MKFRVLFALTLFLHLLVHPLVHAADSQILVPAKSSSISLAAAVPPATPECAVCHLAGTVQIGRPLCCVLVDFNTSALIAGFQQKVTQDAAQTFSSPRAPPAA